MVGVITVSVVIEGLGIGDTTREENIDELDKKSNEESSNSGFGGRQRMGAAALSQMIWSHVI